MNHKRSPVSIRAAFVLAFASNLPLARAQQDAPPPPTPPSVEKSVEKVTEWPTLPDTEKDRVRALMGQFRKQDPELQQAAKKQLLAIGDGAVPLLFQQVSDRTDNQNAQLFELLDVLVTPRHAALVAREVKKPGVERRRYLVTRMCRFGDAELQPVLQATRKDKDEPTAFHAELGLLALKQRDALPAVMTYARLHWQEVAPILGQVLPLARCQEAGTWVLEAMAKAPPAEQMTGLRLLRYLAVKEQAASVRHYLEATDHTVKKEAVNTMRVLHGEPPIENMPVFQVIELAKTWLTKV